MMKKYVSLLFTLFLTLTLCISLAGCKDEIVIDPDAVKITVNGTDVTYGYTNTDDKPFYATPANTPIDFVGDRYDNTLTIDLGENPVENVEVERSFEIDDDDLWATRVSYRETVSMQDGHVTISYGFELFDEVRTADCIMLFHFTVVWSSKLNRVTQYAFSIHCIEE